MDNSKVLYINKDKAKLFKDLREFDRDKKWLSKLEPDELFKLLVVLDTTISDLKLHQISSKGKVSEIKIAVSSYQNNSHKVQISDTQIIAILEQITVQIGLFMVANYEYAKYVHEQQFAPFMDKVAEIEALDLHPKKLRFSPGDLNDKILLVIFYPSKILKELLKIKKQVIKKLNILPISDSATKDFSDPDKSRWSPDDKSHQGVYQISPIKQISFHSGPFGGINELIKNSPYDLKGDKLLEAIKNHHQGKSPHNQTITKWKYYLNSETEFSQYFEIDSTSRHGYYRLYLK